MNMIRSLLVSASLPRPLQDRAHNPINGGDAESFAMAKLVLACRGEGQWSSREEDSSKIDLIFSCEHPWYPGERLFVLTQVKSGSTYGEVTEKGFRLKENAKKAARRTSHGICVVWVDRDANRTWWAYVHPDVSSGPQEYGLYHEVSPATVYDLARCMSVRRQGATGAKGIIVRRRTSSLTARRKRVRDIYRGFKRVKSPILGEVELTRTGWRHMLRGGRLKENKAASLDLIPHLGRLLLRWPSSQAITASQHFQRNGYWYRRCEHLLKYNNLTVSDASTETSGNQVAYIRLIEEVRYPDDWESKVMRSQLVERRVVLKSAYFKPE